MTDGGGFAAQESVDGKWPYTTRPGAAGLWRQPLPGGRAVQVLTTLRPSDWGNWAVTESGVYYVRREAGAELHRWDPTNGRDDRVTLLDRLPDHPALAVSADGGRAIVVRLEWSDSDILPDEDFH